MSDNPRLVDKCRWNSYSGPCRLDADHGGLCVWATRHDYDKGYESGRHDGTILIAGDLRRIAEEDSFETASIAAILKCLANKYERGWHVR